MAFNQYIPQQMYGQYNAISPYQQQLSNMQQQYQSQQYQQGQQGQQAQPQNSVQQSTAINGRAVTGVEEAVASQIPFDGSVSVFTDFGHGKIYTKQLNYQDGSAVFKTYTLVEHPSQSQKEVAIPTIEYAPMSELNALKVKIDELETMLSEKPKTKGATEK